MKPEPVATVVYSTDQTGTVEWIGNPTKVGARLSSASDMDAALAEIAELTADRDSWRDQCSQRVADWDDMRKERDAAKALIKELMHEVERLQYPGCPPRLLFLLARAIEMTGGE